MGSLLHVPLPRAPSVVVEEEIQRDSWGPGLFEVVSEAAGEPSLSQGRAAPTGPSWKPRRGQLALVIFPSRAVALGGSYAWTQPALSLADHFQMCLVKVVKRLTFMLAPFGGLLGSQIDQGALERTEH